MQWILVVLIVCVFVATVDAFTGPAAFGARVASSSSRLHADVEIVFPNNKKVKVAGGSAMKDACKKGGFSPNYGCEEGKCGSCELIVNGKTKIRPCIGKVPAAGPVVLKNP